MFFGDPLSPNPPHLPPGSPHGGLWGGEEGLALLRPNARSGTVGTGRQMGRMGRAFFGRERNSWAMAELNVTGVITGGGVGGGIGHSHEATLA